MALLSKLIDKGKDFIIKGGSIPQIYSTLSKINHLKIIKRESFEEDPKSIYKYCGDVGDYIYKS